MPQFLVSDAATFPDGVRLPSTLVNALTWAGDWDHINQVDPDPEPTPDTAPAPTPAPTEVDTSTLPDTVNGEDIGPLKRAYERQKEEARQLKEQMQRLEQMLGNSNPEEVQRQIAELKAAQERAKQMEQLQAEAEAKYKRQQEELQQQHQGEVKRLKAEIEERDRQQTYQSLFAANNGLGTEYPVFEAVASKYWDYDPATKTITKFKKPDGSTLFTDADDGVKEASAADFIREVQIGTYGKALQACFPPLNRSSGAELPVTSNAAGDDVLVIRNQSDYMKALSDPSSRAYKLIKAGKFTDLRNA